MSSSLSITEAPVTEPESLEVEFSLSAWTSGSIGRTAKETGRVIGYGKLSQNIMEKAR